MAVAQYTEFTAPNDYRTSRKGAYRWLASHILRHKFLLAIGLSFQIINITIQSVVPGIIGEMIALYTSRSLTTAIVRQKSFLIFFMLLSTALVQFIRSSSFETIGAKLERDTRDELYISLLGKSQTFHDKQRIGDIMSRVTQDVRQLTLLMNPGLNLIFMAFTFALVPIIFIGFIHVELLITPIIFFVTFLYLAKRYNDNLTPWSLRSRDALAALNARLNETITGIHVVRGASQEDREESIFSENVDDFYEAERGLGWARAKYWPTLTFGLSLTISIYHGSILFQRGEISIDEFIEFVLLFQLIFLAVLLNSFAISAVSMGLAAAERIYALLVGESEIDLNVDGYAENIEGNIVFEDVSFSYTPDNPVLQDINLVVKPGQTVALVGMTGSGKTTLAKLLGRLYDPDKGEIRIDGIPLPKWSLEALRRQFSLVEQDIFLFSKSVRENITFGLEGITDKQVEEAAKLAQAHEFIMELPDGYATEVGERGTMLSGGQRQRIAIARAIIRNPRVLILDDSSSAIDSKTEDEINTAIRNVLEGRVSFIITHRIAQIRRADLIVLLDNGKIVGSGDHEFMYKHVDKYREIFSIFDEVS